MLETSEQNILCVLGWRTLEFWQQQDCYHQGVDERDSTFSPARNWDGKDRIRGVLRVKGGLPEHLKPMPAAPTVTEE